MQQRSVIMATRAFVDSAPYFRKTNRRASGMGWMVKTLYYSTTQSSVACFLLGERFHQPSASLFDAPTQTKHLWQLLQRLPHSMPNQCIRRTLGTRCRQNACVLPNIEQKADSPRKLRVKWAIESLAVTIATWFVPWNKNWAKNIHRTKTDFFSPRHQFRLAGLIELL